MPAGRRRVATHQDFCPKMASCGPVERGAMANFRFTLGLMFVVASLSASCASSNSTCGSIRASDYDQSCLTASDCVAVAQGDSCKEFFCVDCANVAINVSAEAAYEAALQSIQGPAGVCPCTPQPTVICDAGVCGLEN